MSQLLEMIYTRETWILSLQEINKLVCKQKAFGIIFGTQKNETAGVWSLNAEFETLRVSENSQTNKTKLIK